MLLRTVVARAAVMVLVAIAGAGVTNLARGAEYDPLGRQKQYGVDFDERGAKPWVEAEVPLPEFPKAENLVEFYVSAATSNRFFVDAKSIAVGADDVVRFSVLVKTPSGIMNASFEGIRCKTRERRLYAVGRGDRTWALSGNKPWSDIPAASPNGYWRVLSKEYFCPGGVAIQSAGEGLDALRHGGHPSVK